MEKPKYGNRIYCLKIYCMPQAWASRRRVADVQRPSVIELPAGPLHKTSKNVKDSSKGIFPQGVCIAPTGKESNPVGGRCSQVH